jgi:hypothetical protein
MMEAYKQRLAKEEGRRKRRKEAKAARTVALAQHLAIWENEIIPNWEAKYRPFLTSNCI